jgi:hypothetical protein
VKKALFLAAAATFFTGTAHAGPPPEGWEGGFSRASILCDTNDQLKSIVAAFNEGVDAAQSRYTELFAKMNARHEPTCAVTAIRSSVTGETSDLGIFEVAGATFHGWSIHVANAAGDGYYLYLEPAKRPIDNMI